MKKILALSLVVCMLLAFASCGQQQTVTSTVNYKGQVAYADIAEQLRKDTTLDLAGLTSEKFQITGYAQGYDFDDAWFGSLGAMANSGCQVVLASGSGDFAFKFAGVPVNGSETTIRVGGVDSLSSDFATFLAGGTYNFCSGSYSSMIAPALAIVLRALEGNTLKDADGKVATVSMSHLIVKSADELNNVLAHDSDGVYMYDEKVISGLLTASYNDFEKVANADWSDITAVKESYANQTVATLKKTYKIGVLRNDVTSDEAAGYEAYLTYMADRLGFEITFSNSTGGEATAEKNQIETWASAGYDAIISMTSGSIYGQAETCAKHNMLMVQYAAHSYGDDLIDLQATSSFLGCVGPSRYNEAEVGYKMAKYYIEQGVTKFAIYGGSIKFGADTHAYRVAGMIAAMIENETGVTNTDFNK